MSNRAFPQLRLNLEPSCFRRRLPCLPWFLLGLVSVTAFAGELKLGTAAAPINPPAGIGLAGYYHERGHEGVLDDIGVKATVLDDGRTRAAIVVCDLIAMPKWLVTEARKLAQGRTGIPDTNVMIAATHTHTAPVLFREWSRDEADGGAKLVSRAYSQTLPMLIADAVAVAHGNRQLVRVSVAKEQEPHLANNRRFWMRDGSVGWNWLHPQQAGLSGRQLRDRKRARRGRLRRNACDQRASDARGVAS